MYIFYGNLTRDYAAHILIFCQCYTSYMTDNVTMHENRTAPKGAQNFRSPSRDINQPVGQIGVDASSDFYSTAPRIGFKVNASYERAYVLGNRYSDNPEEVLTNWDRVQKIQDKRGERTTRSVFRGIVSSEVMEAIVKNPSVKDQVEAAVPLGEYGMNNSYLVSLGNNHVERTAYAPPADMKETTSEQLDMVNRSPLSSVEDKVRDGLTFTNSIKPEQVDKLYALWGKTFNWTREEVEGFRLTLQKELDDPSGKRHNWFTGVEDANGELMGAALAVGMELPGEDGKNLKYIESSEWRRDPDAPSNINGIMPGTLAVLNAQILESFGEGDHPFIWAETNIPGGAHVSGHRGGLQIPSRDIRIGQADVQIPQVIVQNVEVGDGLEINTRYRDFAFMRLSPQTIQMYYDKQTRQKILSYVK